MATKETWHVTTDWNGNEISLYKDDFIEQETVKPVDIPWITSPKINADISIKNL